ncbi:MAG: LamG-like jellyroll fold domain-containing protein [Bacteroidota bacterium]
MICKTSYRVFLPLVITHFLSLSCSIDEEKYSWELNHSKVIETGDLKWAPEPFVFEKGKAVRFIDYENGSDSNDGLTKNTPWKHHPWDSIATDKAKDCSGIHTYVFKRGAIYRGTLVGKESGTTENPIRLTSDPNWGEGEAAIYGSELITEWTKGAVNKDIPNAENVWYADLEFSPRCLWMVDGKEIERLKLARTPNWEVSNPDDIKSEWWEWENPEWWKGEGHFTIGENNEKVHLGIDRKNLTKPADYYLGGIVWSEWGIVMGTPFASRIESFDEKQKGVGFQGPWYGKSEKIITKNRYYLEDKPHYLDSPGEFWFEKKGESGRLYVWLPNNKNPNKIKIEAGKHVNLLDSDGMSYVNISGLTFRFTNIHWDLTARLYKHKDIDGACIRLLGSSDLLEVSNCRFEHVNKAVKVKAVNDNDKIGTIIIKDNDIRYVDHEAIDITGSSRWAKALPPFAEFHNVKILRNNLYQIGLRPIRSQHGHAIHVGLPDLMEVAGNVLYRCYGAGLFLFGGKDSGELRDRPLSRMLVHHNKVVDPLLNTNDWGGIETWQGGPAYVYNNISGNPGGYWNWAFDPEKGNARLGYAYYLDGAFKNYYFNNIAWGNSNEISSPLGNSSAFQEIHGYQNTIFNNTIYNFIKGSKRQAPHAGRNKYMGNIWSGISDWIFVHAKPAGSPDAGNEAHAGKQKEHFALEKNAYAKNIFYNVTDRFGVFEPSGRWHKNIESYRNALSNIGSLSSNVGTRVEKAPFKNAEKHDFRLNKESEAKDNGLKVFVPWGLYAECGEWNFYLNENDPNEVLDEHWYMTPYYTNRDIYYKTPRHSLTVVNIDKKNYIEGELEDWTKGALQLNGIDQYCVLKDEDIKPFEVKFGDSIKVFSKESIPSPNPNNGNFLIELYFKTSGSSGTLISKMDSVGYEINLTKEGKISFIAQDRIEKAELISLKENINDNNWHHLITEIDRTQNKLRIYIDGKLDGEETLDLLSDVSLSNSADFYVGKGSKGFCKVTVDFLRIAKGTLADAYTTIDELYKWQFDGPFLKDFTGNTIEDGKRDAGAIEYRN